MIDLRSMGYIRVASTDLEQWRHFAEKVLGLGVGRGPDENNLYYRIDQVSARLVVFPADRDELAATGWELADHQALQQAREHLGSRNWSGSPIRGTTSSNCSTGSPTNRAPSSRPMPRTS